MSQSHPLRGQRKAKETRGTAAEVQRSTMKQAGAAVREELRSAKSTLAYESRLEEKLEKERALALIARKTQAAQRAAQLAAWNAQGEDEGGDASGGGGASEGVAAAAAAVAAESEGAALTRLLAAERARGGRILVVSLGEDFAPSS